MGVGLVSNSDGTRRSERRIEVTINETMEILIPILLKER